MVNNRPNCPMIKRRLRLVWYPKMAECIRTYFDLLLIQDVYCYAGSVIVYARWCGMASTLEEVKVRRRLS